MDIDMGKPDDIIASQSHKRLITVNGGYKGQPRYAKMTGRERGWKNGDGNNKRSGRPGMMNFVSRPRGLSTGDFRQNSSGAGQANAHLARCGEELPICVCENIRLGP
jgi:hypothetical protein